MKNYPYGILTAAVLVGALTLTNAQAQQVPLPKTAGEGLGPPSGTAGESKTKIVTQDDLYIKDARGRNLIPRSPQKRV
jgi:hypothetical protein